MTPAGDPIVPEPVLEEAARRFALLGDPTRPRVVLYSIGDETIEALCSIVCASVRERARVLNL